MNARALCVFILGMCACFAADAQTLFKCVQRDGKTVYQDAKCADTAKETSIRAPAPADLPFVPESKSDGKSDGKTDGKAAPKPNPAAELAAVVEVLANFQACIEAAPGFVQKFGTAMTHWKNTNKEALILYGKSEAAQKKMMQSLSEQRQQLGAEDADGRAKFAANCDQQVGPQTAAAAAR